jgi:hypothetical protein
LAEFLARKFGKEGAKELAEFGGRQGVEEVLEKASKEGGEQLAKKVVQYGEHYGVSSLKVIDQAPAAYVSALDSLPSNLVDDAVRIAAREPARLTPLVRSYGGKMLTAEVRHPGVGVKFAEQLGEQGLDVCAKTTTDQAITIGRHLDEIAALPTAERQSVLSALTEAPGRLVAFLDKHPLFTITAATAGTLIAVKDQAFAPDAEIEYDKDGKIVRQHQRSPGTVVAENVSKSLGTVILIVGCVVAAIVGLWGITKLRRGSIAARLQANRQSPSAGPHDVAAPKDAAQ